MAGTQKKVVVQIEVLHEFYESGKSNDFYFEPTEECAQKMKNARMTMRATPTGFFIGVDVEQIIDASNFRPFVPIAEDSIFTFYMYSRNPRISLISKLPQDKPYDRIFYVCNRFDKILTGTPAKLLLSGHDNFDDEVSERYVVRAVAGNFHYRLSQPNAVVRIVKTLTGEIVWPTLKFPQLAGDEIDCNIAAQGNGRYTLLENNGFKLELYKGHQILSKGVFGVMELFGNAPVPAFRFITTVGINRVIQKKLFNVYIKSLSAIWRYYLIFKNSSLTESQISIANFNKLIPSANLQTKYGVGKIAVWQSTGSITVRERSTDTSYSILEPPLTMLGKLPPPPLSSLGPRKDEAGNILVDAANNPLHFRDAFVHL